ncbi:MAG: SDR family oxidoreductase [Dehalococcoidia bacterium]
MNLAGKSALVTGGGSGIGRAIALAFAGEGADVAVNDMDLARAEGVAEEVRGLGRRALALKADVTRPEEVNPMLERAWGEFSRIDILVNNAGIGPDIVALADMTQEQWQRMLAVHVHGAFNCTRGLIGGMMEQKWGRVISMSSVAGLAGESHGVHYCTAKAALLGFTKALAREVARHGITVNAIAPGVIDTAMAASLPPRVIEGLVKATPLRRKGQPEEIAHVAAFLASDGAAFITGQVISPNGGYYM